MIPNNTQNENNDNEGNNSKSVDNDTNINAILALEQRRFLIEVYGFCDDEQEFQTKTFDSNTFVPSSKQDRSLPYEFKSRIR